MLDKHFADERPARASLAFFLAALSGLLLFVADHPVHLYGLHFVALVPLLIAIQLPIRSVPWLLGFATAFAYAAPMLAFVGSAPPVLLAVGCSFFQWWITIFFARRLFMATRSMFSVAALFCILEWIVWTLVPIFGTAQCFARVTSAVPWSVQFAAWTGLLGIVFCLVVTQGLLAQAVYERSLRLTIVFFVLVGVLAGLNTWRWSRPLGPVIRVAAQGWDLDTKLKPGEISSQARAAGANILVTPEMGFVTSGKRNDESDEARIVEGIHQPGVNSAVGVFRRDLRKNQILFVDQTCKVVERYSKTHLIMLMEGYNAGDGSLAVVDWCGVKCGGMICQDDNFTDLSRGYGRCSVQLMLVPTNDWRPVRGYHLDSSVMRSIETGYGIVRAASGGISAIISPRGEILKSHDHTLDHQPVMIVDDVPTGDKCVTLYSRFGNWPIFVVSIGLILSSCFSSVRAFRNNPDRHIFSLFSKR